MPIWSRSIWIWNCQLFFSKFQEPSRVRGVMKFIIIRKKRLRPSNPRKYSMLNFVIHEIRSTICSSATVESKLNQRYRLRRKVIQLLISAPTRAGIPFASSLKMPARAIPSRGEKMMIERIGYIEMITWDVWRKSRSYSGLKHVSAHTFLEDDVCDNLKWLNLSKNLFWI